MLTDLDHIAKSTITHFVAEVFYEELLFLLEDANDRKLWIKNQGMNSRAFSRDVLGLTSYDPHSLSPQANTVFIHISRNSIYHQLPEILFHPLVLSTPSMSNEDIVEAVRENRKKQEENIHFFIPFDTLLFETSLKLFNRHLNIFTNTYAQQNLFAFAKDILKKDILLQPQQRYKLFLNLCEGEHLKENLPALEDLLRTVLGFEVTLQYKPCVLTQSPFMPLGEGILGYTIGTQGPTLSEQDDIHATMQLTEPQTYTTLQKNSSSVKKILEFFTFANRAIIVQHKVLYSSGFELATNYLGYDTVLEPTRQSNTQKTVATPT